MEGLVRDSCLRRAAPRLLLAGLVWVGSPTPAVSQTTGTVAGQVTLEANGDPVHGAVVIIVGSGQFTTTEEDGSFELAELPIGVQQVLAQREHLTAERIDVRVAAGETTVQDFVLGLSPIHEEVTVTATVAGAATTFEAFNSVTTLDSFDLAKNAGGGLAEALQGEAGVAKRSFGPGSSRPIIRGFDGDRVLIMQDGVRTGDLSSQSGDHGVTLDPGGLERLEVVRGPATLLYGSNAVGGVVNAITPHDAVRNTLTPGVQGQMSFDTGSANAQVGANSSVQYARNDWLVWGAGGSRRSGEYDAPSGAVRNSQTLLSNGRAGVGYSGEHTFFSLGYQVEDGVYGVPFAGALADPAQGSATEVAEIDIDQKRQAIRFDAGMRELRSGPFDSFRLILSYTAWQHQEVERTATTRTIGTVFHNDTWIARADLDQREVGRLTGTLGFWAQNRDYIAVGEEALSPPTVQRAFATFAYEELDFGRYRIQFGGRLEHNAFEPEPRLDLNTNALGDRDGDELTPQPTRPRAFTGGSASIGVHTEVSSNVALVANMTRTYRAPALEELYNFGPHVGNLTFEVGNPDLGRESTLGLDVSLRHRSRRARGSFNVYRYAIDSFVFPALTGQVRDGLRVARFVQGDARFVGFDMSGSIEMAANLWLSASAGLVDATLSETGEPLPRIPPLQGTLSIEFPFRGLTITPELVWAAEQAEIFQGETATDGYTVFNLSGSYIWARQHVAHILSVTGYNLTNALYLNHSSFIKELAPEIGRGIRVGYSLRFF